MAQRVWPMPKTPSTGFSWMASSRLRSLPLARRMCELVVVAVNRQAGRVVAAIFQPFQTLQNDRNGPMRPDVAHDSAHRYHYRGRYIRVTRCGLARTGQYAA